MTPGWEALSARARGLTAHLLRDDKLAALRRAESGPELLRELSDTPYAPFMPPREADPATLEVGIVRSLADRMTTLARWSGPEGPSLAAIFLEQDARNIRHLLRGVVGELTAEQRLTGCIPTPTLGRRALETLARTESSGALAATLVAWNHPMGSALMREARRTHPDLFRLETVLARRMAFEASVAAREGGDAMRRFVADEIDARNVVTALLLAGARFESAVAELFVEGGARLDARDFARAASAPDRPTSADVLSRATRRSLFEGPLRGSPATPAAVAERISEAHIARLRRDALQAPLTALPVLLFILCLRREARLVRRALWGVAVAGGRRR